MDKKILVIEDDPSTSRLLEYALRYRGYKVIAAPNGLEGIKKIQSEAPDLVILDVMLPGVNGYEICRRLRSEPATASTAILIFSARAQESDKDIGIRMGADDYLTKPAAHTEIVAKVEKLLAKKNGAASRFETTNEKVSNNKYQ